MLLVLTLQSDPHDDKPVYHVVSSHFVPLASTCKAVLRIDSLPVLETGLSSVAICASELTAQPSIGKPAFRKISWRQLLHVQVDKDTQHFDHWASAVPGLSADQKPA